MKMATDEIRAIVAETLAEQYRLQQESIDAIVLKAVASVLASFGIEDDDRKELRADFQHLRLSSDAGYPDKTLEQFRTVTGSELIKLLRDCVKHLTIFHWLLSHLAVFFILPQNRISLLIYLKK